jgi:hypothetical protein
MCVAQRVANAVRETSVPMPHLTALGLAEDGFCYKHGAPNGAVPKPAPAIPPNTAKKSAIRC